MARFIRRGVSKILFAPAVANLNQVSRAEITAALDLTDEVADVSGWQLENNAVSTPDMGSRFDKSIPGTDSAADSSLTLYEDEEDETYEEELENGAEGVMLLLRKGDKPTSKSLDTFPVRVASRSAEFTAGNDPARTMVRFTITDAPHLDTPVPSAT